MLIKLCILPRGLFSFSILPETWRSRDDSRCVDVSVVGESCTWCNSLSLEVFLLSMINSLLKSVRCLAKNCKGATLLPPSDVYVRSFLLSLLYFNKTWLHKNSKWSGLISGSTSKSFPLEAKNPGIVHG